jgi:aryl-alcohol dehydrogenase-like predicted oxidoreductase
MRMTTLGSTGFEVSTLGLGTMTFGAESEPEQSHRILDAFVDAGGTLLDCADVYADGRSEEIVGRWLAGRQGMRDRVQLATKGRFAVTGQPGASLRAEYLQRALDASLRRLGVDDVELYQIHGPDRGTPLAEVAEFFAEALTSGRVGHVGVSNLPGWQIAALAALVDDQRLVSHQTQYNLLVREPEWEIFPAAAHAGLGCLAWGPLASGWLTGKYRRGERPSGASRLGEDPDRGVEAWQRRGTERTWTILDGLLGHARRLGRTPADVALTWLVERPGMASALIGARSAEQLTETLGSLGGPLDQDTRRDLDALSVPPTPDYPYGFLAEIDPPTG